MYVDRETDLSSKIFIIDPHINKKAKLSKREFLNRVSYVREIRTAINRHYLSFYITDLDEYLNLKHFHKIINLGDFEETNCKRFGIAIEKELYQWFKDSDYQVIEKQICFWLASLYHFEPRKRHILENQLYSLLLIEIKKIREQFYTTTCPDFDSLFDQWIKGENDFFEKEIEKATKEYMIKSKEFSGSKPPKFLSDPFDYKKLDGWSLNEHYGFDIIEAYFSDSDWERIVNKGHKDDLGRVESRSDLWDQWKHTFMTYNERKTPVYSFYYESLNKQNKNRREYIPQSLKNQIWKRDEGKCVQCGSKLKIEFDHIIPVSKGGTTTFRNLQLLCESCNRAKGNRID